MDPGTSIISNWRFKLRMLGTQHTFFPGNRNNLRLNISLDNSHRIKYCVFQNADFSLSLKRAQKSFIHFAPFAYSMKYEIFEWDMKSILGKYEINLVQIWNSFWWNQFWLWRRRYDREWLKMVVTPSSTLFFLHPLWNASDGLLNQMRLFCYNLRNSSQRCITMEISFLKPWQIHPKSC